VRPEAGLAHQDPLQEVSLHQCGLWVSAMAQHPRMGHRPWGEAPGPRLKGTDPLGATPGNVASELPKSQTRKVGDGSAHHGEVGSICVMQ
jgi:hypothetical protein